MLVFLRNSFEGVPPRCTSLLWIFALGASFVLVLSSCDSASTGPSDEGSPDQSQLAPNVRMKISYDETEASYSNVLPPNIVGQVKRSGVASKQSLESKGVLENYESIRETKTYDNEGYLTKTYTHTDGHARLNMPESAFEALKNQMPRRTPENPIVTFNLEGSSIQLVRENGDVAAQGSVDPERFRMDPELLDSLETLQDISTEERAERTRGRLNRMGVSLRSLSKHHVAFKTKSDENGLSTIRRVVDLRHGSPVYLVYRNTDGERIRVVTRVYGRYNGVPVMRREVSYQYGPKGNERAVVGRTEVRRRNISVQFN